MRVVFNADDFGYSKGVNLGIIEASKNGVVTSTTIMANMPGFDHAMSLLEHVIGKGVHLTLTTGKSLGGVYKTLTDELGNFIHLTELTKKAEHGKIDLSEVEHEYILQIEKIRKAGVRPSHFDGHHHTQNLPGIVDVFLKLAEKYKVATRLSDKEKLKGKVINSIAIDTSFYGKNATYEQIEKILSNYDEDLEIMCHPAYIDNFLHNSSSYTVERTIELDVLTNPKLKDLLAEKKITLTNFHNLQESFYGV